MKIQVFASRGLAAIIAIFVFSTPAHSSDEESAFSFKKSELWAMEYHTLIESFDNAVYSDDQVFSLIASMEASGKDKQAAEEWSKWERNFGSSALLSEVKISRIWNFLRRGKVKEAEGLIIKFKDLYPWRKESPAIREAEAVLAALDGKYQKALYILEGVKESGGSLLLRAVCLKGRGYPYKAAVECQNLIDKYPGTRLCGYAYFLKGNIFSNREDYERAAKIFGDFGGRTSKPDLLKETELLEGLSVFLSGDPEHGYNLLEGVTVRYDGENIAARARFAMGEIRWNQKEFAKALIEFNKVQAGYFDNPLAATALYLAGRCSDKLGRGKDASSTYRAVAENYPYSPEAPAALYLAGAGFLQRNKPLLAARNFQLVLDRYAPAGEGEFKFKSSRRRNLIEAALCLLEYSYYTAGNMGQLGGMPHILLQKMPQSNSLWRAYALLFDADALSSIGRYPEAQTTLNKLVMEFPDHLVAIKANRLLAWTYARQSREDLAISTEERMIERYRAWDDKENMSEAYLVKAHALFNKGKYDKAAFEYREFVKLFPGNPKVPLAKYQTGLCYSMLERTGDAVDIWIETAKMDSSSSIARKSWLRAGDLYFQANNFKEARGCYAGLTCNFPIDSEAYITGKLRLAQCDYNEGKTKDALERFSEVRDKFPGTKYAGEADQGVARSMYRIGSRDSSTEMLERFTEKFSSNPLAPDAVFKLGNIYYGKREYTQAANYFKLVVSRYPDYSGADRAFFRMADSYEQIDSTRAAQKAYNLFIGYFPKSEFVPSSRFRLGMIKFNEGKYQAASDYFNEIMKNAGASSGIRSAALYNMAISLKILNKEDKALSEFQNWRKEGFDDNKRAAQVAYQIGLILEAQGKYSDAAEEYRTSTAGDSPADLETEIYYRLGFCREKTGDPEGALDAYQNSTAGAGEENPFGISALARSAQLYEKRRDYKKALKVYRDIASSTTDPELVLIARDRVSKLEEQFR
ncbi:tetratricopeptide repeat protein [bacterium]|nr:tetratricopeptide repeat protein [bacterium]